MYGANPHFARNIIRKKLSSAHLCLSVVQDGFTPLYAACEMGHNVIVDILLENGADVHLATVSIAYYQCCLHNL